MNLMKSKTAKFIAGFVGLTIAVAFMVPTVKADTTSDLQAQVAALMAQIAALNGGASMSTTYNFQNDLTVGSQGADVTALQKLLAEKGYLSMPAGTAFGYFGGLTKAGVKAWQAASGLPATGFFGPMSRAAVNAMVSTGGTPSAVPGCAAGAMFSATTGAPCTTSSAVPGCAAGAMFSATTGASCSSGVTNPTGTLDNADGSVTLSYVSYAPASQTLKKGDMKKPVVSVKLQAVNGKVQVSRFDVHFSERPWLDFGKLSLIDASGNVLATKTLSGASDVTEVTVGSDYLVRFDNVNAIVTPGTDLILAVAVDVLAASDKITGQTVYVGVPTGSIRTINGKGFTDSVGLSSGQGSGVTSSTGNSVVLSSTGSTGTLFTRISPNTPQTRFQITSATQQTTDVVLGVFSLKSQNQASTISAMSFNIPNSTGAATTSLLTNVRLKFGGQVYGANALTAGNTTFTNMSIPLVADQWTDVTLISDIVSGSGSNNISASSTLVASSVVGVDTNFNTVTLTSATNVTSNDVNFSQNVLNVTGAPTATLGAAISGILPGGIAGTVGYNTHYVFTLVNTGNSDMFVARNPGTFLATTSVLGGVTLANNASSSITSLTVGDTQPGDASSTLAYVVSSGNQRTFTFDGIMKAGAGGGISRQTITGIYFFPAAAVVSATSSAQTITFGLNSLTLSAGF